MLCAHSFATMRDGKGEVVGFISQIEDVTKEKEAERQLAERAAMLAMAMQALRGGFWHMDVASETFETSDRLAEFIKGPQAPRLDLQALSAGSSSTTLPLPILND